MAYQLIYTSSPSSLVHGRTGFSTVARTRDMPEKLAAAVERCSVYEVGSGEVFSHRKISYGGKFWHVLSRMIDSGVDYTNRNNYIAHHLVIPENEVSLLANPAEILAQWDGWISSWDGVPKLIDEPQGLTLISNKNSLPAKNWEATFGNPSTAALLSSAPVTLIAKSTDAKKLLNLFSESLLLNIAPVDAWNYTFTTSFLPSDNTADFLWKTYVGVHSDVVLSSAVANLVTGKSMEAPIGRLSEYASTGVMTNRERLNLKVEVPKLYSRINVIDTSKDKKNYNPLIYGLSSAITAIALCCIVMLFIEFSDEEKIRIEPGMDISATQQKQTNISQPALENENTSTEQTLMTTMQEVRQKIGKNQFKEAIGFWDESKFSKEYPSMREEVLKDIGSRADSLMRYAEGVLSVESPSAGNLEKAIKNISEARDALNIEGVPRKELRESKWQDLNGKIKK